MTNNTLRLIKVKKDIKSNLDPFQMIYVENTYNRALNKNIQKEYKSIVELINKELFLNFYYNPYIFKKEVNKKIIKYNFPYCKNIRLNKYKKLLSNDFLMDYLIDVDKDNFPPSFIEHKCEKDDCYVYYAMALSENISITQQIKIFRYLMNQYSKKEHPISNSFNGIQFCIGPSEQEKKELEEKNKEAYIPPTEDFADEHFDSVSLNLMEDVHRKIAQLRTYGISELVIRKLFEKKDNLSRLVITKKNKIILPDYNKLEIDMRPMDKSVYLLFLRHKEGILFKNLSDYKEELIEIYSHLGNRKNNDVILKSIDDITNPLKNSINEKCSRIREAFVKEFSDDLAINYYITGKKGEPKKIILPENLIIWEK